MNFPRVCAVAATLLTLTVWCTADAWADELPVTITLQVPSRTAAGMTTVTVELRPGGAQSTTIRIVSDADPGAPTTLRAEIGNASFATAAVDAQHAFNWTAPGLPAAAGCGPHPVAGTSGCPTQVTQPAVAAPPPANATPRAAASPPLDVAGQQATSSAKPSVAQAPVAPRLGEIVPAPDQQAASERARLVVNVMPPVSYTVQPGDTLVGIALRFYGEAAAYARIAQANVGHTMVDGQTFDRADLIRPGWKLVIPEPTRAVADHDGARFYTVQRGDTLVGIAARLLGEPQRWSEIYSLNQGAAIAGGPALARNPNLIEPGMQLRLPIDAGPGTMPRSSGEGGQP